MAGGGEGLDLVESATSEVIGNNNVGNRIENKLNVAGVGGTSHVAVNLFIRGFVFGFELRLDVSRCFPVVLNTCRAKKTL